MTAEEMRRDAAWFEKPLRRSKKFLVGLLVVEELIAVAVALGIWGQVGPWPSVAAIATAGFVAVGLIGGQAWLDRYVRIAWIGARNEPPAPFFDGPPGC
jgi:hypothetical protein